MYFIQLSAVNNYFPFNKNTDFIQFQEVYIWIKLYQQFHHINEEERILVIIKYWIDNIGPDILNQDSFSKLNLCFYKIVKKNRIIYTKIQEIDKQYKNQLIERRLVIKSCKLLLTSYVKECELDDIIKLFIINKIKFCNFYKEFMQQIFFIKIYKYKSINKQFPWFRYLKKNTAHISKERLFTSLERRLKIIEQSISKEIYKEVLFLKLFNKIMMIFIQMNEQLLQITYNKQFIPLDNLVNNLTTQITQLKQYKIEFDYLNKSHQYSKTIKMLNVLEDMLLYLEQYFTIIIEMLHTKTYTLQAIKKQYTEEANLYLNVICSQQNSLELNKSYLQDIIDISLIIINEFNNIFFIHNNFANQLEKLYYLKEHQLVYADNPHSDSIKKLIILDIILLEIHQNSQKIIDYFNSIKSLFFIN